MEPAESQKIVSAKRMRKIGSATLGKSVDPLNADVTGRAVMSLPQNLERGNLWGVSME